MIEVNRQFTRELIAINQRLPAAPPIKYGLGYQSRTVNPNCNPNPKTDPNPNPNPKSNNNVCGTKRHRNKVQHILYISYFPRDGEYL